MIQITTSSGPEELLRWQAAQLAAHRDYLMKQQDVAHEIINLFRRHAVRSRKTEQVVLCIDSKSLHMIPDMKIREYIWKLVNDDPV